jgi:dTDP-4-amino-4,6-dideoxygalactose transaminase
VHARHLYTLLEDGTSAGISRDELHRRLNERGISTRVHFRALHLHPFYQDRLGVTRGMFPAAEAVSDTTLSLPLSAGMTDGAVERVLEAMHDTIR